MTVQKIREETNGIIKNWINPKENGEGVIKEQRTDGKNKQ